MNRLILSACPNNISRAVRNSMEIDMLPKSQEFKDICGFMLDKLNRLTGMEVIPFSGSGTAAVEAAICSLPVSRPLAVLTNGPWSYGNTNSLICDSYEIEHESFDSLNPHKTIGSVEGFGALIMTHSETANCFVNDIETLTKEAKSRGMITVVDAMSTFGGYEIDLENVDILTFSSSRCIQGPSGLAFVAVKPEIVPKLRKGPSFYLNLLDQRKHLIEKGEFRFTPPTHIVLGTYKALQELTKETIPGRAARYLKLKQLQIEKLKGKGYELVGNEEETSPTMVMWRLPHNLTFGQLDFELSRKGINIDSAPNMKSFRLKCFGDVSLEEYEFMLESFPRLYEGWAVHPVTKRFNDDADIFLL